MRDLIGEFEIVDRTTNDRKLSQLYSPITQKNIDDFDNIWKPAMEVRKKHLQTAVEVRAANVQDAHWSWGKKLSIRDGKINWESFALECEDVTEGLLFLNSPKISQINNKDQLSYVDLVSTAPWNRHGFTDTPKYKGVGHLLLAAAISYSEDLGYERRLGLHALPQSESWYREVCGMTNLGPDANKHNLCYFEFTTEQANEYLS